MIISIQALRQDEEKRRRQQEERLQATSRFGQFPRQHQTPLKLEGILKFARFLANH
jgi:hypothetical protein